MKRFKIVVMDEMLYGCDCTIDTCVKCGTEMIPGGEAIQYCPKCDKPEQKEEECTCKHKDGLREDHSILCPVYVPIEAESFEECGCTTRDGRLCEKCSKRAMEILSVDYGKDEDRTVELCMLCNEDKQHGIKCESNFHLHIQLAEESMKHEDSVPWIAFINGYSYAGKQQTLTEEEKAIALANATNGDLYEASIISRKLTEKGFKIVKA